MPFVSRKYLYQYGDPFTDGVAFLFKKQNMSQTLSQNITAKEQASPFGDGKVDLYGYNYSLLDASNLEVTFEIDGHTDFDYLKHVFVRNKRKIFFVEPYNETFRVYFNYARYVSGLGKKFETGSDSIGDVDNTISYKVTLAIEDTRFFECDDNLNVLDDTALSNGVYGWGENIPGAGWGQDIGFGWGQSTVGFELKFSTLTKAQRDSYFGNICNPSKFLTYKNTWFGKLDSIAFSTGKSYSYSLSTNDLIEYRTDTLDLSASDANKIWHIKVNSIPGLAPGEWFSIQNKETKSGLKLTWLDSQNSPTDILINTSQPFIYDLNKRQAIPRSKYTLTNQDIYQDRLFAIDSHPFPVIKQNFFAYFPNNSATFQSQKSSVATLNIEIKNLKTYL